MDLHNRGLLNKFQSRPSFGSRDFFSIIETPSGFKMINEPIEDFPENRRWFDVRGVSQDLAEGFSEAFDSKMLDPQQQGLPFLVTQPEYNTYIIPLHKRGYYIPELGIKSHIFLAGQAGVKLVSPS